MKISHETEQLQQTARDIAATVERKDLDSLLGFFTADCEIELLNIKLRGPEGVRKWYGWTYSHMKEIHLERLNTATCGNMLFEEYTLSGTIHNGKKMHCKQSRVLEFEDGKVKHFRLYLDRLQFAESVVNDFAGKIILKKFIDVSIKGL